MTVAGICRITCDVNAPLEVRGVKIIILMMTLIIRVLLIRKVKLIKMILMTTTQVRQRREGSCWNRTSRVNVSSSALPGLLEGDTLLFNFFWEPNSILLFCRTEEFGDNPRLFRRVL